MTEPTTPSLLELIERARLAQMNPNQLPLFDGKEITVPTPKGKPQKGETIEFQYVVDGDLAICWRGVVLEWPRYGSVTVRCDEIVYMQPRYHGMVKVGIHGWLEHTASMYLKSGMVRVID